MRKVISQGAEAVIYLDGKKVIKDRVSKGYRFKDLDEKIRKSRTRKERKLLLKASEVTYVPKVLNELESSNHFSIEMEHIDGKKLSESLNSYKEEKQLELMKKLGIQVAKLHEKDIIHGDLTTSNTLLKEDKIYIIDFGLGFISKRVEDKAVDLHLIKQALEAKHWENWGSLFGSFEEGYSEEYKESRKVLDQLKKVEARGRYKH